jgi:hypothetical protein
MDLGDRWSFGILTLIITVFSKREGMRKKVISQPPGEKVGGEKKRQEVPLMYVVRVCARECIACVLPCTCRRGARPSRGRPVPLTEKKQC